MKLKILDSSHVSLILALLCMLYSQFLFAKPITNQLVKHASPYLAMHGDDPVQWQDWNESVMQRALKENKLIFISSGYFSCHWCHVMQRESYKNKNVAKILNKYFIPVKVDRELNPALDARLIDFVEKTHGQAGWPLNVFITPSGYPLVGMTYLPAKNFIEVLNNLKTQWLNKRSYLNSIAKQATAQLLATQDSSTDKKFTNETASLLSHQLLSQTADLIDEIQGGFGEQNKFPSVPQLRTILHIVESENLKPYIKNKWTDFLTTTLDSMAQQGLRDHVNGGFYRYTVDPNWQIPHFEKMLYDNAQLAILYFEASKIFNRTDYQSVAIETLKFLQTDMKSSIGVAAASLSAVDDNGIEGGCYVWQEDDLKKYLNAQQYKVASNYWKLVTNDALDSGYHLIQTNSVKDVAKQLSLPTNQVASLIQSSKEKLKQSRKNTACPIDEKPVAAWLGLSLHAFSLGTKQTGNQEFLSTAKKLYGFISSSLWSVKNNRLYRSIKKQDKGVKAIGAAGLEDYALIAKGIYHFFKLTDNSNAEKLIITLTQKAWERFYKTDGWYLSEKPLIKYTIGKAVLEDSPLPSPSAILIQTSLLVNNKSLNKKAQTAIKKGISEIEEAPYWFASHIDAIRLYNQLNLNSRK